MLTWSLLILANHITPIEFETRLKSFLETLALFKTRVQRDVFHLNPTVSGEVSRTVPGL